MIKLEFSFPDLGEVLKKHQRDVLATLAATMQTNRAMMFDKDGADNGKPAWKPPVFRKGRPLQDRGTLRRSMAPSNDGIKPGFGPNAILRQQGTTVVIGTNLLYAAMMNDGTTKMPGGVLRPVRAQALKIPVAGGGNATDAAKQVRKTAKKIRNSFGREEKVIFRKSVKIPARPMNIVTSQDEAEFATAVANRIAEILNG